MGTGVPLGVLFLATLEFLLYREHRSRKRLELRLQKMEPESDQSNTAGAEGFEFPIQELHHWARQPELHLLDKTGVAGRQRLEIAGQVS